MSIVTIIEIAGQVRFDRLSDHSYDDRSQNQPVTEPVEVAEPHKGLTNKMIRKATEQDIPAAMNLFIAAKSVMRSSGNLTQWKDGYPNEEIVRSDISKGGAHIVERDGQTVGYFALLPSPEPTYSSIKGRWLDDETPYFVIHRIASSAATHGIFQEIIEYAASVSPNLRIDTHLDNSIMRHLIEKAGFAYCGIIRLADGSERLAYQKVVRRSEGSGASV